MRVLCYGPKRDDVMIMIVMLEELSGSQVCCSMPELWKYAQLHGSSQKLP